MIANLIITNIPILYSQAFAQCNIPIIHSLVVRNLSQLKSVEQDRNVVSKAIWLVRFTLTKYFRKNEKTIYHVTTQSNFLAVVIPSLLFVIFKYPALYLVSFILEFALITFNHHLKPSRFVSSLKWYAYTRGRTGGLVIAAADCIRTRVIEYKLNSLQVHITFHIIYNLLILFF